MRQDTLNLIIGCLLALVLLANTVLLWQIEHRVAAPAAAVNETPKVELIAIKASQCAKCSDVKQVVDAFTQAPSLNVTKQTVLESTNAQAIQLIADYNVKRLPAIILKGDIAGLPAEAPRVKDAIVIDQLSPPLYDLENKTVQGLVDVTLITTPLCAKCSNVTTFVDQLKLIGIGMDKVTSVAYDSKQGAALLKDYNISAVPTIILSDGASWYPQLTSGWNTIGTVESGNYIMRQVVPPYIDIATGKVRGIVNATFLADKSCTQCYDPLIHTQILGGYGMEFDTKPVVDVSSDAGKALIKKYNITLVPTVIVTGDTSAYAQLLAIWDQVGTVEKDNALVFRSLDVLSVTYKDLATGNITVATAPAAAAGTGAAVAEVAPSDTGAPEQPAPTNTAPEQQAPAANSQDLNNALAQGLS
jgi:hypothetical protein